jgi:membrane protein
MTRGTIFITISWAVVTSIYSIYANNFANYNVFYSSLANVVVLMFWIYILSYLLVLGIAINSERYLYIKQLEEEKQQQEQEKQEEKVNEEENLEDKVEESNE